MIVIPKSLEQLKFRLAVLKLISTSFFYRYQAGHELIGREFDSYGRKFAFRFLGSKDWGRFINLLCNPVSSTRYFEFPFCLNALNWNQVKTYLDISSPRLFLLYLLEKYPHLQGHFLNPDVSDLAETQHYFEQVKRPLKIQFLTHDVTGLPYPDQSFDVITSISVLEHIPKDGDSLAVRELWRVLKPHGKLILTLPCAVNYEEEWREEDTYNLGYEAQNGKYFFQRFYDQRALKERIFDAISQTPQSLEVWGEKQAGTFQEYIEKWIKLGLLESIKDPYYVMQHYQSFPTMSSLVYMGICGLVFEKL
ncbi:class I SAM-dependent methyltransferase [Spirulina subsalsa FACHB-351]|uniref:Class I SAM-dependent methyltransferase n=1 Tax=Spirulina subsalsa FACHB-351 TaxID=234711 RepID=A0ABT3L627_9CYAN|nr:class I SAM-dependent methyltransferase [Spirulina subsalsa]MCW6036953.1 class I SAM-dependent methyltransferase [Spirulina subsalsa FACHB-351]